MEDEDLEYANLFKEKKKKKKVKEEVITKPIYSEEVEVEVDKDDMTYDEMLARCYEQHIEESKEAKRLRLAQPKITLIGSKRTGWSNFVQTASLLHRDISHISSFIEAELGTTLSHAKEGVLLMKGRFRPLQIETILRKYIDNFVKCRTCKSNDTILQKSAITRLTSCKCNVCYSEWTVEAIHRALPSAQKQNKAD
jgi:translation initiation factor 2 subunit 2